MNYSSIKSKIKLLKNPLNLQGQAKTNRTQLEKLRNQRRSHELSGQLSWGSQTPQTSQAQVITVKRFDEQSSVDELLWSERMKMFDLFFVLLMLRLLREQRSARELDNKQASLWRQAGMWNLVLAE